MTKDPKIEQIVDRLLEGTKKGFTFWTEEKTILTTDTSRRFHHKSNDGLTIFNMEIRLDNQYNLTTSLGGYYMYIYNKNLPSGTFQVSSSTYPNLELICIEIYKKCIAPTLPQKNQSKALDEILDGLEDLPDKRDRIIEEILEETTEDENSKKTLEPTLDTNDKTPTEERKGFFKKLLGL